MEAGRSSGSLISSTESVVRSQTLAGESSEGSFDGYGCIVGSLTEESITVSTEDSATAVSIVGFFEDDEDPTMAEDSTTVVSTVGSFGVDEDPTVGSFEVDEDPTAAEDSTTVVSAVGSFEGNEGSTTVEDSSLTDPTEGFFEGVEESVVVEDSALVPVEVGIGYCETSSSLEVSYSLSNAGTLGSSWVSASFCSPSDRLWHVIHPDMKLSTSMKLASKTEVFRL